MIFKRTGPYNNIFIFFILIFVGAWAIGLWLKPIGPSFYGYYWIGYLAGGILLAFIIASAGPPNTLNGKTPDRIKQDEEFLESKKRKAIIETNMFMAALIIIFLITILLGYLTN
jgi:hypothetical protein